MFGDFFFLVLLAKLFSILELKILSVLQSLYLVADIQPENKNKIDTFLNVTNESCYDIPFDIWYDFL